MKKLVVIVGVLALIMYYFLFPQPLSEESYFVAKRGLTIDIPKESKPLENLAPNKAGQSIPLQLGSQLVFLDTKLALKNVVNTENVRVTYSEDYYALYDEEKPEFNVFAVNGSPLVTIKDTGVPIIFGQRIFSVDHMAGTVKHFEKDGTLKWSYNVGAYITSMHANETLTIIGGLNGYVTILSEDGKLFYEYRPGGSASEVIYGSAISDNGQYFAIISGLGPQRFLLFRRGSESYVPVYHTDLKTEMTTPVRIKFSKNSDLVLYEEPGLINGYRIPTRSPFVIPIGGELKEFSTDIFGSYFGFLVNQHNKYELRILNARHLFTLVNTNLWIEDASIIFSPKTTMIGFGNWVGFLDYVSSE